MILQHTRCPISALLVCLMAVACQDEFHSSATGSTETASVDQDAGSPPGFVELLRNSPSWPWKKKNGWIQWETAQRWCSQNLVGREVRIHGDAWSHSEFRTASSLKGTDIQTEHQIKILYPNHKITIGDAELADIVVLPELSVSEASKLKEYFQDGLIPEMKGVAIKGKIHSIIIRGSGTHLYATVLIGSAKIVDYP